MFRRVKIFNGICLLFILFGLSFCRGYISKKPPIHLNPNMDSQQKYKPFGSSSFFKNGMMMRPIVEETMARGMLKSDTAFYNGIKDGSFIVDYPPLVNLSKKSIKRGQYMFNRACSHCHGFSGDGNSIVAKSLPVKPRTFHSNMSYERRVGDFYNIIVNGTGTMAAHACQVKSEIDRWNIVSYIRVLQLSKNKEASKYFLESKKSQEIITSFSGE